MKQDPATPATANLLELKICHIILFLSAELRYLFIFPITVRLPLTSLLGLSARLEIGCLMLVVLCKML